MIGALGRQKQADQESNVILSYIFAHSLQCMRHCLQKQKWKKNSDCVSYTWHCICLQQTAMWNYVALNFNFACDFRKSKQYAKTWYIRIVYLLNPSHFPPMQHDLSFGFFVLYFPDFMTCLIWCSYVKNFHLVPENYTNLKTN